MVDYQIRPVMVEVKGVPKVLDTKGKVILELLLENKRRAGGDRADFDYTKLARGKVYVTYSNPEVAEAVAKNEKLSVPHPEYDITVTTYTPPPEVPHKVRVTGLSTGINKETLALFFENSNRSGGGEMEEENLTFKKQNTEAIITYKDPKTAEMVLQKYKTEGPFHFSGCTMEVFPVRQHAIDKRRVQLRGIGERMNRETLELFIENKRKSGGGNFLDLQLNLKRGTALVTFEEVTDACEVVERGRKNKLEINQTRLTAEHYVPPSDSEEEEEEEAEKTRSEADQEQTESGSTSLTGSHSVALSEGEASCDGASADPPADDGCPSRCVEVTGVPRELTQNQKDSFEMLFENLAKDQDATFDYDKLKKGKVYITFTSPKTAGKVATVTHVDLPEPCVSMSVCLFSQPPVVPNKIRLIGLKPNISDHNVQLFFENSRRTGGGPIERYQPKRKGKQAVVTYTESKHASAVLQRYVEKGPFDLLGCNIDVREVREATPDGRSVLVGNIGDSVTDNILEMYLANFKRSGGGNVMKVDMKPHCRAIVTFQTADIVKSLMKKSETHGLQLSNSKLTVQPYVPESSSEEEEAEQAPEAAGGTASPQEEAALGSAASRVQEAAPPTPGFLPGFYLFKGIPGSFDLDTFELLVENKAKVGVKSMTKGDEENRDNILVRIDLSQDIDVMKLTSTLRGHKQLRGLPVCVERVKDPECVLVEKMPCKMDEEMLQLFLEGQAGGAFEMVEVKKYSSSRRQGMVVCFSDYGEADRFYKHTHEYKEHVFRKVLMIEDFGPWSKG